MNLSSIAAELIQGPARETIQQFMKLRQRINKLLDNLEQLVLERIEQYLDAWKLGEMIQNAIEPYLDIPQLAHLISDFLHYNNVNTIHTQIKYTKINYSEIQLGLSDLLEQIKMQFSQTSEQMRIPQIHFDKEFCSRCIDLNYFEGRKVQRSASNFSCLLIDSFNWDLYGVQLKVKKGRHILMGIASQEKLEKINYEWDGNQDIQFYGISQNGYIISQIESENENECAFEYNNSEIVQLRIDIQKQKLYFNNLANSGSYNLDLKPSDLYNLKFVVFLKDVDDEVQIMN